MRFVFTKYDSSYYILMSQNGGKNTGSGGNFSTVGKRGYWYRGLRERWRKGSKCFLLRRRSRRMVCFEWEGRRLTQGSTMLLAIYSLRYSYGSSKHRYQKKQLAQREGLPQRHKLASSPYCHIETIQVNEVSREYNLDWKEKPDHDQASKSLLFSSLIAWNIPAN